MRLPTLKTTKSKKGSITDPVTKRKSSLRVIDEVRRAQTGKKDKTIVLQRVQFDEDKRIELRLAYYIIGKRKHRKGSWVWGQYATLLPACDLQYLFYKAMKKDWFRQ